MRSQQSNPDHNTIFSSGVLDDLYMVAILFVTMETGNHAKNTIFSLTQIYFTAWAQKTIMLVVH